MHVRTNVGMYVWLACALKGCFATRTVPLLICDVYACMYTCMYVWECMHFEQGLRGSYAAVIHTHASMHAYIQNYVHACTHSCLNTHTYSYTYLAAARCSALRPSQSPVCIYICVYVCIYICVCVCITYIILSYDLSLQWLSATTRSTYRVTFCDFRLEWHFFLV